LMLSKLDISSYWN